MLDLRTVRLAAGLTQLQAARLLGVSLRTLQDWEGGQTSTARTLAARLLAVLTRQERLPRIKTNSETKKRGQIDPGPSESLPKPS